MKSGPVNVIKYEKNNATRFERIREEDVHMEDLDGR